MEDATVTATRTLTAAQVARELGCSPRTVRRLADDGEIRTVRLTDRSPRRYVARDVERLAERLEVA